MEPRNELWQQESRRASEAHKLWLYDLSCKDRLSDEEIIKGFTRYYVLPGLTVHNVKDDLVLRTCYTVMDIETAIQQLQDALWKLTGEEENTDET